MEKKLQVLLLKIRLFMTFSTAVEQLSLRVEGNVTC